MLNSIFVQEILVRAYRPTSIKSSVIEYMQFIAMQLQIRINSDIRVSI